MFDIGENATLRLSGIHFDSKQSALLLNPGSLPLFLTSPIAPQALDDDRYSGAYTMPGGNRIKNTQLSSRLDLDNDAARISIIGSYIDFKQDPSQDLDGAPNDNVNYFGHVKSKTYSLEFRLTSQDGGIITFNDHFRWVMGAYLFQDKGSEISAFTTGKDNLLSFLIANPALLVDPTYAGPFVPGSIRFTDSNTLHSNLKSVAFYGQGTFDLTDQFAITLGARYTSDERDYTFLGFSDPIKPFPGFPVVPTDFSLSGSPSSTSFDPKVVLEFKPMRDVLAYASFSKGYKSGAVQSTAFTSAVAALVTNPERVKAYEIGLKSEFFNNRARLNISAFVNKFSNLQVRRVVLVNGFSTAISENAATSTIKGLEVEASAMPVRNLRINASYAYLDAKYDNYVVDALANLDFSGNHLPRAPKNRFNIDATYTHDFDGGASLELRAAYNYTGTFFFQPDNLPIEREKGYGLTDASATFTLANGTTSIQAWGRNIFGVEYRTYLDPLDQERVEGWSDKATYGVTLMQKF